MSVLSRHLARHLLAGWTLALVVGAAVFGLLFLLAELERLTESYRFADALAYTLLTLPQRLTDLTPIAVLFGTLLALAVLESGSELTVMAAAGVGAAGLARRMALPLAILACALWLAQEFVTPHLNALGEARRLATYGSINRYLDQASWTRLGRGYAHLGGVGPDGQPRDLEVYRFGPDGTLAQAIYAPRAQVVEGRRWELEDALVKETRDGRLATRRVAALSLDGLWLAEELPMLRLSSASMPLTLLAGYQRFLAQSGQQSHRHFAFAFWRRATIPLAAAAMALLALPLGGRPGRGRRGSGRLLALGVAAGILFYLGSEVIFALGALLDWPAPLTALLPPAATAATALALFLRRPW